MTTMTTIGHRAFAVLWWLLHAAALFLIAMGIALTFDPVERAHGPWVISLIGPLPLVVLAITRWVLTGRWRFGPRW